jgi:hypothetical protein
MTKIHPYFWRNHSHKTTKGANDSRPLCYASLGNKLPALNNEFG